MALIDDAFALIAPNIRAIGSIIPDCTIEEKHFDRVSITEHPVETGAAITDHAFRAPAECVMRIGFSNSTAGAEGWVQEAYQMLRDLKDLRQPFDVYTGKRVYSNMLIELLEVTTENESEFALNCVVALREIIIVSTQQGAASTVPTTDQAAPDQTSSIAPGGNQQIGVANGVPSFAQTSQIQTGGASSPFGSLQSSPAFAPTVAGGFTASAGIY